MATQLGEAFVPIRATLDKLDADLEGARSKVEGAMGKIGQVAKGVGENLQKVGTIALAGLGVIGTAALGAAAGIAALAANAEPLVGLQGGFAAVTERIGVSADVMLKSLQDASNGLISNRDLMTSFNKASALVGDDFGKRLPEAMDLVGRASRATGQDMGFLLDSLVTGIGRVSPMILDNLGIQVTLAQVTERAGEMFGKSTEELSKQEQQAALTDIVMEKLSATYSDVPDVSMPFARARTMVANFKDELGLKLLPAIAPVAEAMIGLAEDVLPILAGFLENNVVPAITSVTEAIAPVIEQLGGFFTRVSEGIDPLTAFQVMMMQLLPPELFGQFMTLTENVKAFIEQAMTVIQPIIDWIASNVSLQDVLIALGIAIATVVLPIIWSLIASVAPIIAAFLLVVATVALLRNAWEKDFGGIRTALTEVWEKYTLPIFNQLKAWLGVNIPIALQFLSDFWTNVLQPAITSVVDWMKGTLMPFLTGTLFPWLYDKLTNALRVLGEFWTNTLQPAIKTVWNWLSTVLIPFLSDVLGTLIGETLPAIIQTLSDFWTNTLQPAIKIVWAFLQDHVIPLLEALGELISTVVEVAVANLAKVWKETLQPALKDIWKFIQDKVIPILEDIGSTIEDLLKPPLKWLATFLNDTLKKAWDKIGLAIDGLITKIKEAIEWFKKLKPPPPFEPGSPTPFEMGIRGISSAMKELDSIATGMPLFNMDTSGIVSPVLDGIDTTDTMGTSYSSTTNVYTDRDPMRVLRASRHLDKLGAMT